MPYTFREVTPTTEIDPFVLSTNLSRQKRYNLALAMLQDEHIYQARLEFNSLTWVIKSYISDGVLFPNEYAWLNQDWFNYLILKNQFHPGSLTINEQVHLSGIQHWIRKHTSPCNVCNLVPVLPICKGTNLYPEFYLYWDIAIE